MITVHEPPPQFVASVQKTPYIPIAPPPFATKEGNWKFCSGPPPPMVTYGTLHDPPRLVDCVYANAAEFAVWWKKIVNGPPLVTMMLGLVSFRGVPGAAAAADPVPPS